MGTNFYLMSKSKKLMREYFSVKRDYGFTDEEYEIVDEPYLGYEVHLNKLSAGWRPLFQKHRKISTFKELEDFCLKNNNVVGIYDEYGKKYTWEQYYDRVYSHSQRKPEPFKWVYEIDTIFNNSRKTVHTIPCTEQEAEIYMPFCHRIYNEKEKQARKRFKIYDSRGVNVKYWEDPDYPFDWTEGDFC